MQIQCLDPNIQFYQNKDKREKTFQKLKTGKTLSSFLPAITHRHHYHYHHHHHINRNMHFINIRTEINNWNTILDEDEKYLFNIEQEKKISSKKELNKNNVNGKMFMKARI